MNERDSTLAIRNHEERIKALEFAAKVTPAKSLVQLPVIRPKLTAAQKADNLQQQIFKVMSESFGDEKMKALVLQVLQDQAKKTSK